jgi:hypothetical protein
MARGLTTAVKNELATQNIKPVLLIEIGFPTPIYITNNYFDLTSSVSGTSRTYTASGHLLSIDAVTETNTPTKNTLTIGLSGVDQTYISVVLNTSVTGDIVRIYQAYLDSSNAIIADPFLLYYGTIDDVKIQDSVTTASLTINVTSHWGAFDKISGRTTANNSQKRFFSSDEGMSYSAVTIQDIEWGLQ